jgi:outer membrane receptor protein involved in Fe transport
MTTLHRCLPVILASGLALSPAAFAQTTAPAKPDNSELVELSAFTVQENSDTSYIASESVTGTRTATKIADLPYAVSVITSEFMNDFDIFSLTGDLNGVAASLNNVDDEGTYSLRGLTTFNNFYLRNGFYRLGMVDRVNTDRIEVIKGPNAALYGATNPAGMINIVSKAPKPTAYQSLALTLGPNDSRRVEFNVNQPLGSVGGVSFANLLSVQGTNTDTPAAAPSGSQTRVIDDVLRAKFKDGSTLTAEFEWSRVNVVPGYSSSIPNETLADGKTLTAVTRPDLVGFNQDGPVAYKNRSAYSAYLTYEKRFNSVWSSRVNGYWYRRPEIQFNVSSSSSFNPFTQTFAARSVQVDELNQDGGAFQIDTVAKYSFLGGAVKGQTLFTLDYSQNLRFREIWGYNTKLYSVPAMSIVSPDYTVPPFSAFTIVTRKDKTRADTKAAFVSQQIRAFDNRLIAFASLRRDVVTYNLEFGDQFNTGGSKPGSLKTAGEVLRYDSKAWSPSLGLNYKLTKQVAFYTSYSQSFAPQLQVAKLGTPPLNNERAKGYDYGFKVGLFDNRLQFTTGGFYIDRTGVKATVKDPLTGLNETVAAGSQNAKGFEIEGSWRATDNLTVLANYSYTNARITYNGNAVTDVGQPPAGVPIDQAYLALAYRFTGALKGLSWHPSVNYTGVAFPNSTQTDVTRNLNAPSNAIVNMGLTYAWRQEGRRLRQSIRLSAKNLLDRQYQTPGGNLGLGRGIYFAYSVNH